MRNASVESMVLGGHLYCMGWCVLPAICVGEKNALNITWQGSLMSMI